MGILKTLLNSVSHDSVLDIGCRDASIKKLLCKSVKYVGIDTDPEVDASYVYKKDFMKLNTLRKYDIVIAMQTLEHLPDPVKAIHKMRKLSKGYLIISVPYEPIYSLFRLPFPNKEHKFAIFPWTLKEMLGVPVHEQMMVFGRQYLGMWKFKK